MGILVYPQPRSVKPPPGAQVNWGHPLAAGLQALLLFNIGGGGAVNIGGVGVPTTLGTPNSFDGIEGPGANAAAQTDEWSFGDSSGWLPTRRVTVAVIRRKTDTTARASGLFGLRDTDTDNIRCGAHAPWSDGNIYWDFGGTASPNRVSYAWSATTAVERFVFVGGPSGAAIWLDGNLKVSSTGDLSRQSSAIDFRVNGGNGVAVDGDVEELYYFAVFDAEWGGSEVQWWTAEPYSLLIPTSRRRWMVPTAGQIFERSTTDGIYLIDAIYKGLDLNRSDFMFIQDQRAGETALQQLDKMLVSDAAFVQAIRQLLVIDGVYIKDDRITTYDKVVLDTLLVADVFYRTIEKIITDGLYVKDDATIEKITALFERLVTDGVYLLDTISKTEEHTVRDSFFLSDARIGELLKQLTDRILTVDFRVGETSLSVQDRLLVNDLVTKIQEKLIVDGLYVYDSATAQLIQAVVDALVWARIQALDALGITIASQDLLGRTVGSDDLLGRVLGVNRWRGPH